MIASQERLWPCRNGTLEGTEEGLGPIIQEGVQLSKIEKELGEHRMIAN